MDDEGRLVRKGYGCVSRTSARRQHFAAIDGHSSGAKNNQICLQVDVKAFEAAKKGVLGISYLVLLEYEVAAHFIHLDEVHSDIARCIAPERCLFLVDRIAEKWRVRCFLRQHSYSSISSKSRVGVGVHVLLKRS